MIGKPAKEFVIRCDGAPLDPGVPSEAIIPAWFGLGSDEITLADSPIQIADFGEAFDSQTERHYIAHTPFLLAPPESLYMEPGEDEPLSFSGDIWTLACSIWELFESSPPFQAFPATPDRVTIEHVEMLGKLPERWWKKWEARSNWFDDKGKKNVKEGLLQFYGNSSRGWDQRFPADIYLQRESKKFAIFSPEEEKAFCSMIKSMLILEPSRRATIENVVRCEWMQNWGFPEMQRMRNAVNNTSTM